MRTMRAARATLLLLLSALPASAGDVSRRLIWEEVRSSDVVARVRITGQRRVEETGGCVYTARVLKAYRGTDAVLRFSSAHRFEDPEPELLVVLHRSEDVLWLKTSPLLAGEVVRLPDGGELLRIDDNGFEGFTLVAPLRPRIEKGDRAYLSWPDVVEKLGCLLGPGACFPPVGDGRDPRDCFALAQEVPERRRIEAACDAIEAGDFAAARDLLDWSIETGGGTKNEAFYWAMLVPLDLLEEAAVQTGAVQHARWSYEQQLALERRNGRAGTMSTRIHVQQLARLLAVSGDASGASKLYERELRDTEARCGEGPDVAGVLEDWAEMLERSQAGARSRMLRARAQWIRTDPRVGSGARRGPACLPW